MFREKVIPVLWLLLAALIIGACVGVALSPKAHSTPGIGCESIRWGFLGSQQRTICDGPKRPDGSWERGRMIWTPAHYVPVSCYSGRYYSSCNGGYYVDDTVQEQTTYIVFDYNVLPDEPGWLPSGSVEIH